MACVTADVEVKDKIFAQVERVSVIRAQIERVCLLDLPYLEVIPVQMWIQSREVTQVRTNRNWRIENN